MKKLVFSIFSTCLFMMSGAFAQDVHFSQFFSVPLTISPSNTGNFDGDWRVYGIYRSQWKQITKPYTTFSVGGDAQIYAGGEKFSAGLYVINDKSGGSLKVNKIMGSLAYHKQISKHVFHVGVQPGYVLKSNDYMNETFPSQMNWETGGFDKSLANNETGMSTNLSYLDVNAGAGYSFDMKRFRPYVAFAMFHLNKPKESFVGGDNKLSPRTVISGGAYWFVLPKFTIAPGIVHTSTKKASEFLAGANFYYSLGKDYSLSKTIFLGSYIRHGFSNITDANYYALGMTMSGYTACVSYDINISELKVASNNRGAFEISLIYTGLNTRSSKTQVPCDRY